MHPANIHRRCSEDTVNASNNNDDDGDDDDNSVFGGLEWAATHAFLAPPGGCRRAMATELLGAHETHVFCVSRRQRVGAVCRKPCQGRAFVTKLLRRAAE